MEYKTLIEEAIKASNLAYAPYSNFRVGASMLLRNNKIISGCNIENKSYGLSMCAERVVLYKAISEGVKKEDILALAVVGSTKEPITPCGACREVMAELLEKNTPIILANTSYDYKVTNVSELLPLAFNMEK